MNDLGAMGTHPVPRPGGSPDVHPSPGVKHSRPRQRYLRGCQRTRLVARDRPQLLPGPPEPAQSHSYREIADVLETPMGTVMSRLARRRALLQKALTEDGSMETPHGL